MRGEGTRRMTPTPLTQSARMSTLNMLNGGSMLGVRIDKDLERKLDVLSRQSGRSKSDVAREAIRRYLEAHDLAAEARQQSQLASASPTTDPDFDDRGWTA